MKYAKHIKSANSTSINNLIKHEKKEAIRLNKYIGSSGLFSRREADRLIADGRVKINGDIALIGSKVTSTDCVFVDDVAMKQNDSQVYIALNKPIGITCTTDANINGNITNFMNYKKRIFPIGRLDKPSSGLILLTNDGDIVNKVLRSINNHEKEYIVHVDKTITSSFLDGLRSGTKIYNPVSNTYQTTKKCKVTKITSMSFNIVLTEGLNRQIRRMCTAHDYHVTSLKRIRVMNVTLQGLKPGEWRYLDSEELKTLNNSIN